MVDQPLWEFDRSDQEYLSWISRHPEGYVLNTTRSRSTDYLVLHKAGCPTISQYEGNAQPGGFTEREYVKICADTIDCIHGWVRRIGGSVHLISKECYCWKDDWW